MVYFTLPPLAACEVRPATCCHRLHVYMAELWLKNLTGPTLLQYCMRVSYWFHLLHILIIVMKFHSMNMESKIKGKLISIFFFQILKHTQEIR